MLIQPTHTKLRRRVGLGLGAAALIAALGLTASTALADPAETPTPPPPPAVTSDGALTVDRSRDGTQEVTRIVDGDRTTIILRTDHPLDQAEIDRLVAEERASRADAEAAAGDNHADGHQVHRVVIRQTFDGASGATPPEPPVPPAVPGEHRRVVIVHGGEVREGRRGNNDDSADSHRTEHRIVVRHAGAATEPHCPSGSESLVDVHETGGNGPDRSTIRIFNCASPNATREARLSAVRAAREALANADTAMVRDLGDVRLRALARLDAQIAELERAGN